MGKMGGIAKCISVVSVEGVPTIVKASLHFQF